MLFNSIEFAFFLPLVFTLFWISGKYSLKLQNTILLLSSLVFYGWWDWRFLSLLVFSGCVDFNIGYQLGKTLETSRRKTLLGISLITNLGLLGFFKYYNFFLDNFVASFSFFGQDLDISRLDIVLPVGISFYTFQTLSYTIDVYRKNLKPTKDFIAFSSYVSFFPQLVAGPIERATNLLPQFFIKKKFEYGIAVLGMRQILWGLFKKMVIADNCAQLVDIYFSSPDTNPGYVLLIGAILFTFQIYCDFSGYSDIAIGTAKLFGFNLMQNFAFPYFSRNIAEFWRRWHISLSTWFRDYLYIPMGGSKGSRLIQIRNIFIIFVVSGFWHGANWNFIFWGLLNAFYFLPSFLKGTNQKYNWKEKAITEYSLPAILKELSDILITFILTVLAWVFFRSENLQEAFFTLFRILTEFTIGNDIQNLSTTYMTLSLVFLLVFVEWIGRRYQFALQEMAWLKFKWMRWGAYSIVILLIGVYSPTSETPFIYFQF